MDPKSTYFFKVVSQRKDTLSEDIHIFITICYTDFDITNHLHTSFVQYSHGVVYTLHTHIPWKVC